MFQKALVVYHRSFIYIYIYIKGIAYQLVRKYSFSLILLINATLKAHRFNNLISIYFLKKKNTDDDSDTSSVNNYFVTQLYDITI